MWEEAREEARRLARPALPQRIIGADLDENALRLPGEMRKRPASPRTSTSSDTHFADLTSKRSYGCVICNPPYGQRMGGQAEIQDLYRAMPDVFRRLKTWSFYVLTAHPAFEALLGQEANRRRKLYNGRIECTYYQYYGPKPGVAVALIEPAAGNARRRLRRRRRPRPRRRRPHGRPLAG